MNTKITLREFATREREFCNTAELISNLTGIKFKVFHVEDISNEACWTEPEYSLPKDAIYTTSSIGHYLSHDDTLFMLYGARRSLQLTERLRKRYAVSLCATIQAKNYIWLSLLPHDPQVYCNPVQCSVFTYVIKARAEFVNVNVVVNPRYVTVEQIGPELLSIFKIYWDCSDENIDKTNSAIISRIEELNAAMSV